MDAQPSMNLVDSVSRIYENASQYTGNDRCMISASPELLDNIKVELEQLRRNVALSSVANLLQLREPSDLGLNDGTIYPPSSFPAGSPVQTIRNAAADRAPLQGSIRVIVVLVEFPGTPLNHNQQHFQDLFFSTGVLPNGSVKEYYTEVTQGLVTITGEVVGPYQLPSPLATYAHAASGLGNVLPNARTMARDAALAADPDVNFSLYDNNSDGYVDAFIVIHAGLAAEVTGSSDDIWSHKWVLSGGAYNADGTNIYAYLTVPEDAKIGVCCHELGHLLFGFPDLYDTDYSSSGIGNWCLMSGGSWNGGGDIPSHPSAWCKANQGWATVINQTSNADVTIQDVEDSHLVYRLWTNGTSSSEYFLVENRQRTGYDRTLPGSGLLVWHIDEAIAGNTDENHPKVALLQADGLRQLETAANRGDAGDPFPGTSNTTSITASTQPNTRSYAGTPTNVAITNISASGPGMTAHFSVRTFKGIRKEAIIEKHPFIDKRWFADKAILEEKRPDKSQGIDKGVALDKPFDKPFDGRPPEIQLPVPQLQAAGGQPATNSGQAEPPQAPAPEPFIGAALRPDLRFGALLAEGDQQATPAQPGYEAARAKRHFDTKLPEM